MNNAEAILPELTRDDVLAGQKTIVVLCRNGTAMPITVKALPWRVALITGAMFAKGEIAEGVIKVLQHAMPNVADGFLDGLVPAELTRIANISQLLSNGVDSVKNGEAGTLAEASPALPTSGKSNVSCARPDTEMQEI